MNKDYRIITENDILEIVKNIETGLIIKKAENSMGGRNIHIWMPNESIESLINVLKEYKDCVVQQLVKQHESLSYLHKDSVNTIRIVTWNRMNEIIVLSSIVRMGVNGKKVDNASSGGIFCGINEDGTLKDVAYDTTGKMYEKHPQGAIFKGHKITNFDKCVTLVKSLAPRFSSISRLTSWDLAIDQNGEPLIIEANLSCGELDFHQITNGPLFGDYTEEMIKEVFAVKKYRRIRNILSLL